MLNDDPLQELEEVDGDTSCGEVLPSAWRDVRISTLSRDLDIDE
jgi:hypothetical protein